LTALDLNAVQQQLAAGRLVLLDVREACEFAREHIAGARLMPMSSLATQLQAAALPRDNPVVVCCATGNRSLTAMRKLAAAGYTNIAHVDGGLAAWKACGLPLVEDCSAPINLIRQVQIVAGLLVVAGTGLGVVASPWFLLLPGMVGADLIFAGASGSCLMAQLLARLPHNKSPSYVAPSGTA
jgi:rhodanese-related sulfurtransferase